MKMRPFSIETHIVIPSLPLPHLQPIHMLFSLTHPQRLGRYAYFSPAPNALEIAPVGCSYNPWDRIEKRLSHVKLETLENLPPFQTGIVGYLGYEMGRHLECLPVAQKNGTVLPEMVIGMYHLIAAFDTAAERAWVIATPTTSEDEDDAIVWQASSLADKIANGPKTLPSLELQHVKWKADFHETEYCAIVENAIEYINAGDIFQTNITQRFCTYRPSNLKVFDIYRLLRDKNPAPYAWVFWVWSRQCRSIGITGEIFKIGGKRCSFN